MRQWIVMWSCLLFILLVSPSPAAEPIVIYTNDCKPPLSWIDNGTPKGVFLDILRQIETRTGLTFDIRPMPWKRAYTLALEGQGGIIGLSVNRKRLYVFDFSDVIYSDEMRLVTLADKYFPFNTVEDLKGKTIGFTRGASYGNVFDRAKMTIFTPVEDAGPVSRLRMLLAGRIDAALIGPGEIALKRVIDSDENLKLHQKRFVILTTPFSVDPNYIAFSKSMGRIETLQTIDRALEAMWEDGTMQQIEDRYCRCPEISQGKHHERTPSPTEQARPGYQTK